MTGALRVGMVSGILTACLGCATESAAVAPPQKARALTEVMRAEAEPEPADSRAYTLRMQARQEYEDATRAEAKGFAAEAARRYDAAAADGELSVALARRDAWTAQARDKSAVLNQLRALETSGRTGGSPEGSP